MTIYLFHFSHSPVIKTAVLSWPLKCAAHHFLPSRLAAAVDTMMESHVHIFKAGISICLLIT